jgi:hypothetical protein
VSHDIFGKSVVVLDLALTQASSAIREKKMSSKIVGMMLLVIFVTFGPTDLASAAQKVKKLNPIPKANNTIVVSPLTEAECVGLGGKVLPVSASNCAGTGKKCFTTDMNGVIHESCITQQ